MKLAKEVIDFAKILPGDVLVVGGYVRDYFLNKNSINCDIDLCGSVDIENFKNQITNDGFTIELKNKKLGVYKISKNNISFEYARFRKEYYNVHGDYYPTRVEFTKDISEDVKRRDFTINSIYYSIKSRKFYDKYCGRQDIDDKILRAIEKPEIVFNDDATRILRLIRFYVKLKFEINERTLFFAKENSYKLKLLNDNVIKKELLKIKKVVCDNDTKLRFENICKKLNVFNYFSQKTMDFIKKI